MAILVTWDLRRSPRFLLAPFTVVLALTLAALAMGDDGRAVVVMTLPWNAVTAALLSTVLASRRRGGLWPTTSLAMTGVHVRTLLWSRSLSVALATTAVLSPPLILVMSHPRGRGYLAILLSCTAWLACLFTGASVYGARVAGRRVLRTALVTLALGALLDIAIGGRSSFVATAFRPPNGDDWLVSYLESIGSVEALPGATLEGSLPWAFALLAGAAIHLEHAARTWAQQRGGG